MKIRVNRKDSMWSVMGIITSMGSNLIILPFILHYLDESTVGLYYVFINIYAIISLMDFGFSPNFARNVVYAWSGAEKLMSYDVATSTGNEQNWPLIGRIVKCCRYIYFLLALLSMVLCATLGTIYISHITKSFVGSTHFISWGVFILAIFAALYFGYLGVILRGTGAIAQINQATVLARMVQIAVCIVLLSCGMGLLGVSIGYFVYGITFYLTARRKLFAVPGIKEKLFTQKIHISHNEVADTLRAIWPNTWREGLIAMSNYLLNQATTLIASLTLSLYETGVYSLMVQLVSAVAAIAGVFYTSYQPALQSARANNDTEDQRRIMSIMVSSYTYLYALGTVAMILLIAPLVELIKSSYVIETCPLLLVSLLYFIVRIRDCFCSYFAATNRLIYTKMFVLSSVLCVVLAWLFNFCFHWGMIGLILAQIVSQAFYNVWYWPLKANKELHLTLKRTFVDGVKDLIHDLV